MSTKKRTQSRESKLASVIGAKYRDRMGYEADLNQLEICIIQALRKEHRLRKRRKAAMSTTDAEKIVKNLAQAVEDAVPTEEIIGVAELAERVLREKGLVKLIEAGQAMRDDAWVPHSKEPEAFAWDSALAALQKAGAK